MFWTKLHNKYNQQWIFLRMEKSIQRWKYKLSKKTNLKIIQKYLTFTVFLSTREYKWRIFRDAWLNTGGLTLGWTDVSSRGGGDSNAPSRFMLNGNQNKLWLDGSLGLTLYTLTSVCIFSTYTFPNARRIFFQSKGFFPGDHFRNSHDCNVWFRGDIVRRN